MENLISIPMKTPYYTYGEPSGGTNQLWFVFHGYGQLAQYFIRRFDVFDAKKHFVIAPQGLSRFYVEGATGKVGASWMTKELREIDIENQMSYLDAVWDVATAQLNGASYAINLLGFSQGVATMCRWASKKQVAYARLVIWAGGFPIEMGANTLVSPLHNAEVSVVIGNTDKYFNMEGYREQILKITAATQQEPSIITFDGGHELNREVLMRWQ